MSCSITAASDAIGLAAALDDVWRLLVRGAGDRRSPCHTPVVASVDADGLPAARVMVLRRADRAAATLRFHTDARSPKVPQLDGRPVAVLAYHAGEAVQLRLAGTAEVATQGPEVDAAWTAATAFARRCYLATAAPGSIAPDPTSGLPAAVEGRAPDAAELLPARANFALVTVRVTAIDWLHLAQGGHRRARFTRAGGVPDWSGDWLVP